MQLTSSGEERVKEGAPKSKARPTACICFVPHDCVQEEGRRLEFPWWLVAWDRFAIASQAIPGQLTMQQALLHKDVVINIACSAAAGGRTDLLGVLYDELARPFVLFAP